MYPEADLDEPFTVDDPAAVSAQLDRFGVCVVRGVVEERLLVGLDAAIVDALDRPSLPGRTQPSPAGMVDVFHDPRQWELRQDPSVVDLFQRAVGCTEIWMSVDRLGLKPPSAIRPDTAFLHWDTEPEWAPAAHRCGYRALQGLIYLSDVAPDGGAFHCVPDSRSAQWRREYLEDHPLEMTPGGPVLTAGTPSTKVPGRRGDVVLWEYAVAHGASLNTSATARRVAYITARPAGDSGERRAHAARVAAAAPPAWVSYPVAPEQPFTEFTPLGARVAGMVTW